MTASDNSEVYQLATNLARNLRWPVFPVSQDKAPAIAGGNGLKDASLDPDTIKRMFAHPRAALIGIRTGAASGIDALDIDTKTPVAMKWWGVASRRVPPTRIYRTRRGGLHIYFCHAEGVVNSASKLAEGVDVRGEGGAIVFWFAAGFECIDHSPIAPWPSWLLECVLWKSTPLAPVSVVGRLHNPEHADKAIEGVLRVLAGAREGERNACLHWAARRLRDRAAAGQISQGDASALLVAAARSVGLTEVEAKRTVASAWRAPP